MRRSAAGWLVLLLIFLVLSLVHGRITSDGACLVLSLVRERSPILAMACTARCRLWGYGLGGILLMSRIERIEGILKMRILSDRFKLMIAGGWEMRCCWWNTRGRIWPGNFRVWPGICGARLELIGYAFIHATVCSWQRGGSSHITLLLLHRDSDMKLILGSPQLR
jgi:hypothetical protein